MYAWHSSHVTMVTETQEWHIGIGQKAQWYNWWSSATWIRWHVAQRGSREVCGLLLKSMGISPQYTEGLVLLYFPGLLKYFHVVAKNMIEWFFLLAWMISCSLLSFPPGNKLFLVIIYTNISSFRSWNIFEVYGKHFPRNNEYFILYNS